MTIKGYELHFNDYLPEEVVIYLRKRMQSLAMQLQKKLGKNYNVSLNFSKKSEAGYFIITPVFDYVDVFNGFKNLTLSIRNHQHGKISNYDVSIILCDFDSWDTLKRFVLNDCAHYIKSFDKRGLKNLTNDYLLQAN